MSQKGKTYAELGLSISRIPVTGGIQRSRMDSGGFAPTGAPYHTQPRTAAPTSRGYYEALNDSPDRTPVPDYGSVIRNAVRGYSRERLARLGDYFFDNDGLVGYAVTTIANYSVPITPQAAGSDAEVNRAYDSYFSQWSRRADYTGRFDLDTIQRVACIGLDTKGEAAAILTEENGIPQLQLIPVCRITDRYLETPDPHSIDGVKHNGKGVIVGYYVYGDDGNTQLISSDCMVLIYDPERSEDYRGISPMRRGLNDVRDAKDIKGFEKLATKISSALAAVLEGSDAEEADIWGSDTGNSDGTATVDPLGTSVDVGNPIPTNPTPLERNISTFDLLGGDIPVLPEGKTLKQLDNNRPGERVIEMLSYLGGYYISGLGIPPAFLIDDKLTGPNQRSVNEKAAKKFEQRQVVMARLVEWVYVRVIAWGINRGMIPTQAGWDQLEWQGPAKVSIDGGRDAMSWREDVSRGLMSRQNFFANRSQNWRRETDQGFVEDDYIFEKAAEQAERHGVPVEWILTRWGFASAKVTPGTTPASGCPAGDCPPGSCSPGDPACDPADAPADNTTDPNADPSAP